MGKTIGNVGSPEWAKHLRPKGKRKFWRLVRRTAKLDLKTFQGVGPK